MLTALATAGLAMWCAVLALPWRPWSTRERLEPASGAAPDLSDVAAIVPARDEATTLPRTLAALAGQGSGLAVVVVDDESRDGTAEVAAGAGIPGVAVVRGAPLPAGWTGKVWAQEQGRRTVDRPLLLLVDADVVLEAGVVAALRARLERDGAALASVLAELPTGGFWERLLVPAFVFFFKLLYPFRLANDARSRVAAAAGGCILVRAEALDAIGGFAALREALIDDCTLARLVKRAGYRTWIGLSRAVCSARRYRRLADFWDMVARTAYTQLGYSIVALAACSALMACAFLGPLAGLAAGRPAEATAGLAALGAMAAAYTPTLRFYRLSPGWALALPVVGTLFLAMTWTSAARYWGGQRSAWRGRRYARGSGNIAPRPPTGRVP